MPTIVPVNCCGSAGVNAHGFTGVAPVSRCRRGEHGWRAQEELGQLVIEFRMQRGQCYRKVVEGLSSELYARGGITRWILWGHLLSSHNLGGDQRQYISSSVLEDIVWLEWICGLDKSTMLTSSNCQKKCE